MKSVNMIIFVYPKSVSNANISHSSPIWLSSSLLPSSEPSPKPSRSLQRLLPLQTTVVVPKTSPAPARKTRKSTASSGSATISSSIERIERWSWMSLKKKDFVRFKRLSWSPTTRRLNNSRPCRSLLRGWSKDSVSTTKSRPKLSGTLSLRRCACLFPSPHAAATRPAADARVRLAVAAASPSVDALLPRFPMPSRP